METTITNLCSICLKEYTIDLTNLNHPESTALKAKLKVCVPELTLIDTHEALICSSCTNLLDMSFDFKIMCLESERELRQLLKSTEHNTEPPTKPVVRCVSPDPDIKIKFEPIEKSEFVVSSDALFNEHSYACLGFDDVAEDDDADAAEFSTGISESPGYGESEVNAVIQSVTADESTPDNVSENVVVEQYQEMVFDQTGSVRLSSYQCIYCFSVFNLKRELTAHMKTHKIVWKSKQSIVNDGTISCNVCSASFPHLKKLRQHMNVHSLRSNLRKCEVCDVSFSKLQHFNRHMRSHTVETSEKILTCKKCKLTFSCLASLSSHMQTHQVQCKVCGCYFTWTSQLRCHMKSHLGSSGSSDTGSKSRNRNVRSHMKSHLGSTGASETGSKSRNRNVRSHMKSRLGPKGASESVPNSRNRNVRARSSPHMCKVCNKTLTLNDILDSNRNCAACTNSLLANESVNSLNCSKQDVTKMTAHEDTSDKNRDDQVSSNLTVSEDFFETFAQMKTELMYIEWQIQPDYDKTGVNGSDDVVHWDCDGDAPLAKESIVPSLDTEDHCVGKRPSTCESVCNAIHGELIRSACLRYEERYGVKIEPPSWKCFVKLEKISIQSSVINKKIPNNTIEIEQHCFDKLETLLLPCEKEISYETVSPQSSSKRKRARKRRTMWTTKRRMKQTWARRNRMISEMQNVGKTSTDNIKRPVFVDPVNSEGKDQDDYIYSENTIFQDIQVRNVCKRRKRNNLSHRKSSRKAAKQIPDTKKLPNNDDMPNLQLLNELHSVDTEMPTLRSELLISVTESRSEDTMPELTPSVCVFPPTNGRHITSNYICKVCAITCGTKEDLMSHLSEVHQILREITKAESLPPSKKGSYAYLHNSTATTSDNSNSNVELEEISFPNHYYLNKRFSFGVERNSSMLERERSASSKTGLDDFVIVPGKVPHIKRCEKGVNRSNTDKLNVVNIIGNVLIKPGSCERP